MIAPYEAVAQLAYLKKINNVNFVMTLNFNFLIFDERHVFYKMNKNCYCVRVRLVRVGERTGFNFEDWTHNRFIQFCIFTGNDYLPSPNKFGIREAYKVFSRHKTIDEVIHSLKKNEKVESDYYECFLCAYLTFKYQRVYCPIIKVMVNVNLFRIQVMYLNNDYDYRAVIKTRNFFGGSNFLGCDMNSRLAQKAATFEIDTIRKRPFNEAKICKFLKHKKPPTFFKEYEPPGTISPTKEEDMNADLQPKPIFPLSYPVTDKDLLGAQHAVKKKIEMEVEPTWPAKMEVESTQNNVKEDSNDKPSRFVDHSRLEKERRKSNLNAMPQNPRHTSR